MEVLGVFRITMNYFHNFTWKCCPIYIGFPGVWKLFNLVNSGRVLARFCRVVFSEWGGPIYNNVFLRSWVCPTFDWLG